MRNTITRTITTSKIHSVYVDLSGETPTFCQNAPITVNREVRQAEAQKMVTKRYGAGVTVTKIELNETLYEISIDDFVKYGKPVVKAGEQE